MDRVDASIVALDLGRLPAGFYRATCMANGTSCERIMQKMDDTPGSDWQMWARMLFIDYGDLPDVLLRMQVGERLDGK